MCSYQSYKFLLYVENDNFFNFLFCYPFFNNKKINKFFFLANYMLINIDFRFYKACFADRDCSCAKTESPVCIHDLKGHYCKCVPIRKYYNLVL